MPVNLLLYSHPNYLIMDNIIFSLGDFDYLVLSPVYENQLISVISESFSTRGKLAVFTGISKETLALIVRGALDDYMSRELTVMCVHRPTQELCGGMTVSGINSDVFEHSVENISISMKLITGMDRKFFSSHNNLNPRQCLHQHMLGVSHKWAGNKIGENLILASLQVGKAKGFTYALIELTVSVSQHICLDVLNYTLDQEVIYSEHEDNGIKPFESLDGVCVLAFKEII